MDYIERTLGLPVQYGTWEKQDQLPFFLLDRYQVQAVWIGHTRVLFLSPTTELEQLGAVKKHIARVQKIDPVPVALLLPTISRQRKEYLIAAQIPFVVPEKQIYLPFLGIALQESYTVASKKLDKFQPSSQVLFLYYLYQKAPQLYTGKLAETLGCSAMTITRAIRQLAQTGLFEIQKEGVQNILVGKYAPRELFQAAMPYLISPVRKKLYVDTHQKLPGAFSAGLTALSKKTMLNPPELQTYALASSTRFTGTDMLLDASAQVEVELWRYDPAILGSGAEVDALSLVLSLQDERDERIQDAVEELTKNTLEALDDYRN
jgi:hypothetical protein